MTRAATAEVRLNVVRPAATQSPGRVWPELLALLAVCGVLASPALACSPPNAPGKHGFVIRGRTMGTTYSVVAQPSTATQTRRKIARAVETELQLVDGRMSSYKKESELSLFNRSSARRFRLTAQTAEVVRKALLLARKTEGAFDPTVAPLVRLWGFSGAKRRTDPPDIPSIKRELRRVGHARLRLQGRTLYRRPRTELNLDAIAKGYGVDRVAERLEAMGIRSYMVEVGGEVRTGAPPQGRANWRIAVEKPAYGTGRRQLHRILAVNRMSVATSGDYRNYFTRRGRRYSHIVDPRTGHSAHSGVVSATVVGPECMTADALATALLVLPADRGLAIVRSMTGYEALLLVRHKVRGPGERKTPGFARLIVDPKRQ